METVTIESVQNSKQVKARLETLLTEAGFHTAVSFDLQSARKNAPCNCPYHKTLDCTCQFVVLLIDDLHRYPQDTRTITIHASDDVTWVSLPTLPFSSQPAKSDPFGKRLQRILLKSVSTVEA